MTVPSSATVRFGWLNFQSGGKTSTPDGYDFSRLRRLIAPLREPRPGPHATTSVSVFAICEAKEWGQNNNRGLLSAGRVLSDALGRPYVGKLCAFDRGPIGPALFYDPTRVEPEQWPDGNGYPTYIDQADVVSFRTVGTGHRFVVIVRHWSPWSPEQRKDQARLLGRYGDGYPHPVYLLGDLNTTASGPRWPRRDWTKATYRERDAKAIRLPDGTPHGRWVDATDAVDHLIGWWNNDPAQDGRTDGCGFWAVPELAHATGTPLEEAFQPTVNRGIDAGGGQIIDHCLTNQPYLYLPGSYRVHVPQRQHDGRWDSDHRLGEAAFDLTADPGAFAYSDPELARQYRLAA